MERDIELTIILRDKVHPGFHGRRYSSFVRMSDVPAGEPFAGLDKGIEAAEKMIREQIKEGEKL